MKRFYLAPTAIVLDPATRPDAIFEAPTLPGDPDTSLVVVEEWRNHQAEDAWDALPDVEELPYYNWHLPPPPRLSSAASTASATVAQSTEIGAPIIAADAPAPAETIADAMKALRKVWPAARI